MRYYQNLYSVFIIKEVLLEDKTDLSRSVRGVVHLTVKQAAPDRAQAFLLNLPLPLAERIRVWDSFLETFYRGYKTANGEKINCQT